MLLYHCIDDFWVRLRTFLPSSRVIRRSFFYRFLPTVKIAIFQEYFFLFGNRICTFIDFIDYTYQISKLCGIKMSFLGQLLNTTSDLPFVFCKFWLHLRTILICCMCKIFNISFDYIFSICLILLFASFFFLANNNYRSDRQCFRAVAQQFGKITLLNATSQNQHDTNTPLRSATKHS